MRKLPAGILFLAAVSAWSQTGLDLSGISLEGVHHAWDIVPTGADIAIDADPWKLVLGAGLDQPHFGREDSTGDLRPDTDPYTTPLLASGQIALLRTWHPEWADAWLGPQVVGYQALGTAPSAFADWTGNVYWALEGGLKRDRRVWNDHGLVSGYWAQATGEWSPTLLSLKGTDFYQLKVQSSWYVPLWDLPGENQLFSGVLALRADAQYTDGSQVPLVKLDPTEVRGYNQNFDAKALTAGSVELRMRLPSWYNSHDIVPVGFGFFDAGTYSGFADAAGSVNKSGLLAGAGIGGGLELFGKATPSLTLAWPLIGVSGLPFLQTLWWDLSFQLAF